MEFWTPSSWTRPVTAGSTGRLAPRAPRRRRRQRGAAPGGARPVPPGRRHRRRARRRAPCASWEAPGCSGASTSRSSSRPSFNDDVELATFCSGWGPAWAERRTDMIDGAGRARSRARWRSGCSSTAPAGARSTSARSSSTIYGTAARGRRVTARLRHPKPPAGAAARPWPLRETRLRLPRPREQRPLPRSGGGRAGGPAAQARRSRGPRWSSAARSSGASDDRAGHRRRRRGRGRGRAAACGWSSRATVRMSARVATRFTPVARALPK